MYYDFSVMTAEQALAYDQRTDSLTSLNNAYAVPSVVFDPAGQTFTLTLSSRDGTTSKSLVFGSGAFGMKGRDFDVWSPGADFTDPFGSTYVFAGPGDDVIRGGQQAYGGTGSDTFIAGGIFVSVVKDWERNDKLYLSNLPASTGTYYEGKAVSSDAARVLALEKVAAGINYVVLAVGDSVVIYSAGPYGSRETLLSASLSGRELDDISIDNIVTMIPAQPAPPVVTPPTAPPPPTPTGIAATISGNMDAQHLSSLTGAVIREATSTTLSLGSPAVTLELKGAGLTYDANQQLTGGMATALTYRVWQPYGDIIDIKVMNISAANFAHWVATDATQTAFNTLLAGDDSVYGSERVDLLRAYAGNDVILGGLGADTIFGGAGNDVIAGASYRFDQTNGLVADLDSGGNYLRGDEGNDSITGGSLFDDINGNQGNDVIHGANGNDWVVGGQDQDLLYGDGGNDIVYGNLGADTVYGGDGDDWVRGGQGDDVVDGGAGIDWLWGDRGNDTVTGGAGADVFHSFSGAGIDRITDFKYAEGDRIVLDDRTLFVITQVGGDTVITIGGADQIILVGVSASSLATDAVLYA